MHQWEETNDRLEKVATSHNCNFMGGWFFFVPLQEQFAENANKSYHVCKVIVVLQISIIKCFVSDKQDLLQTKLKVWPLSNFE